METRVHAGRALQLEEAWKTCILKDAAVLCENQSIQVCNISGLIFDTGRCGRMTRSSVIVGGIQDIKAVSLAARLTGNGHVHSLDNRCVNDLYMYKSPITVH